MAKKSCFYLSYTDSENGFKINKGEEVQYSDKHQHGVQPSDDLVRRYIDDLIDVINNNRGETRRKMKSDAPKDLSEGQIVILKDKTSSNPQDNDVIVLNTFSKI